MPKASIAVIGGKLQGIEAAYLGRKAGWRVVLVDKTPNAPGRGLCDTFVQADILQNGLLSELSRTVSLMLPALENEDTLSGLEAAAQELHIPIAFDFEAYRTTVSKTASNRLFAALDLPCPLPWPDCGFPVLAKPVSASGSSGVLVFRTQTELERFVSGKADTEWVLQEYVSGPSYSLEILGCKGKFASLTVTDLDMDEQHDCCRVSAPSMLDPETTRILRSISERIAAALDLTGIMDVEAILSSNGLRLLEIDARLPSQTPTAVYWSTGVNMVQLLADVYGAERLEPPDLRSKRAVIYEHVRCTPDGPKTQGEHIMTTAGPLRLIPDFFGADEALTDFAPEKETWVATLIMSGENPDQARAKRSNVLSAIRRQKNVAP